MSNTTATCPAPQPTPSPKQDDKLAKRQKFVDVFSKLRAEMLEVFTASGMPQEASDWFGRVSLDVFRLLAQLFDVFGAKLRASTIMFQAVSDRGFPELSLRAQRASALDRQAQPRNLCR